MARKSQRRAVKRAARETAKVAKKYPKIFVTFLVIVLILAIAGGAAYYFLIYKKKNPSGGTPPTTPVETDELSIHFLELGNKYTGDCTLIKINDVEVLIDAGSKQNSATAIIDYIESNHLCEDGTLEYVIATHAHEDHIGAFYSTSTRAGIFEQYTCETIIDFPLTNKSYSSGSVYGKYVDARNAEVENEGAKHYTALECWNQTGGAQRSYSLAQDVTLNILYQKYYEQTQSRGENDYSVCVLLTQGTNNYLFTGDLEAQGESSLVDSNDLPHCNLFKGGHHGSSTSTTDTLLAEITPDAICICACAGSPEYTSDKLGTFPTQECVDRMAQYTDKIYVTSLATNVDWVEETWDYTSMNGNILVTSKGEAVTITGSNNSTILKDTAWFLENRVWNGA